MGQGRKSSSNPSNDQNYPSILRKLCKEEDVLIVPEFVTLHPDRLRPLDVSSPTRSRESRLPEKSHVDSGLPSFSDEEDEDEDEEEFVRPPKVGIAYEFPEEMENPLVVACKNIFIEYSLIEAIGKSLSTFPTIETLRLEDCCVGKDLAEGLAGILAEEPGRRISDLSLDGNSGLGRILPLFLSSATGLKYLSLQRCGLDDEDVGSLAEALACSDGREQKLLVLNLGMNKIGNGGVSSLANALRTNRTLISLSLIGNRIGDEGAVRLAEILKKFELTPEEIVLRRRRIFDRILREKKAEAAEESKSIGEIEKRQISKSATRNADGRLSTAGRKVRGPDGKICLSGREKRGKFSLAKLNSAEKFGWKTRGDGEEGGKKSEAKSPDVSGSTKQSDAEMAADEHPFVSETSPADGRLWCVGCWSILSINLAYNYLTESSADKFLEVVREQAQTIKPPKSGLTRIVLTPGNSIPEFSEKIQDLQNAILNRNCRKETSEMSFLASASSRSPTRKMTLASARRSTLVGKTLEE